MKDIAGIIFSGDCFRSTDGQPEQIDNVMWLERKIGTLLSDLTGKPHATRMPLVGETVSDLLSLQAAGLTPSLDTWAALFWDHASAQLIRHIGDLHANNLIVTIEMSPITQDALDRANVPWIDVSISPLRFMPDWAFHIKASSHFDLGVAADMVLSQAQLDEYVHHVRTWYGAVDVDEPTLVFFGQTLRDRTLISNNGFAGQDDVLETIEGLRAGRPMLIKPHPWQPTSDIVDALVRAGGKVTDLNTYALLSSTPIAVASLSSSVGREARLFGRQVTTISPLVQDWAFSGVDVLHHALSPRFWGALLASAGIPVQSAPESNWGPNVLRGSIPPQGLDPAVWGGDASVLRA